MSYEKNTWANGDVITAAKLNNMEDGIADSEYDLVILCEMNPVDVTSINDFEIISGSIEELTQKLADGSIVKAVTVFKYAYGQSINTQFTYELSIADVPYLYLSFICPNNSTPNKRSLSIMFNSSYELTGYEFNEI